MLAGPLLCCVAYGLPPYRAETCARWKKTPFYRVIYEVGSGVMGLIVLGALIWLIVVNLS
jgi:hypothetical protein